ncbi:hypothetical protein CANTEDRAFT_94582 [Yamadazyma tenuis ATCC 10573]|uniref:Uncharacterized protein n=1 Tax=Candida tenuis (strain ATCC 10573 / BCRC 21748 / CBS 615 / JCM 9827 / NBRC 10315 / NRRL Y-1498 / VKM Y-70) TaxID=590646 RepID=G3B800_CANTC|nr:uncharacterized protein CANTEDRAFT_94582 [Yamadazyma tenuis ATCC 10573]EGV62618.1 hypothetical protein CANTEDRAFT_94582 [Yamadazyma tenuis ATCC 10573]
MTVQLTQENFEVTTDTVRGSDTLVSFSNHHHQDTEYELDQSESLTFLYNLLYDEQSQLTKSDILNILHSLKQREDSLPFSYMGANTNDIQGVDWPPGLKEKFYSDRRRIGSDKWFHNIPGSLDRAVNKVSILSSRSHTEFFKYHKFYSKLKLHITHFQLRNLTTNNFESTDSIHSYFKINRLSPDEQSNVRNSMQLDCVMDSRSLLRNSNSRISTLACSDKYLVSGTFEGDYILTDISDPQHFLHLGEHNLTRNYDGITNSIVINDNKQLIASSNDKSIRLVDLSTNHKTEIVLPFAGNCLAMNRFNPNEIFVSGDYLSSFILDKRIPLTKFEQVVQYKGQEDYSFSCDWSPTNENLLLSGNQDGNVRIWDKRFNEEPLFSWKGSLGLSSGDVVPGPVRNTKFSHKGQFVCWGESLDHVGIVNIDDLHSNTQQMDRIQSIDFIGKCTGLSFCETENGYGEQLIIGVNDCPLGGILSYSLESSEKCLDFDLRF